MCSSVRIGNAPKDDGAECAKGYRVQMIEIAGVHFGLNEELQLNPDVAPPSRSPRSVDRPVNRLDWSALHRKSGRRLSDLESSDFGADSRGPDEPLFPHFAKRSDEPPGKPHADLESIK